ncbi:phage terminase small subunit [Rummeliibacillus sp. BSL5]
MPRARDPNRDKAKKLYLESSGKMLLKDIAEQLEKSDSQIRKWKNQDKWADHLKGNVTNQSKGNVTKRKAVNKVDGQKESKSSGAYRSNPKNQFTKRNEASVKHGFYRKWLPQDMLEIIEDTKTMTLADRLWFQIETKFASLIQLHKIMFVENRFDTLREEDMTADGQTGSSTRYKVVYAFEQYAEYIKTEARLTAEWRNVVKQFLELSDEYDERRMKLEQMQLNIEKTKTDIERNNIAIRKETGEEEEYEDDGFIEALGCTEVSWDD